MKRLFSFLSIVLIVFLLVGCANPTEPDNTLSDASSEAASVQSEEESLPAPESSAEPDSENSSESSEVKNIVFMGNSLINTSNMPAHLRRISNGRYNATNASVDGATLQSHLESCKGQNYMYRQALSEADIVVFQEYGGIVITGSYGFTDTGESLKELVSLCKEICKPDTKYYLALLSSVSDSSVLLNECFDVQRECDVELLPIGEITSYICDTYFSWEEFHLPNDYHPNQLQGNMMAMAFLIIEDDESCTDGEWAGSNSELQKTYPDKTKEEINEEMKRIQKDAYDHYQKVKSNYFS